MNMWLSARLSDPPDKEGSSRGGLEHLRASSWFSHDKESHVVRERASIREIKTCDDLFHKGRSGRRENPCAHTHTD